MRVGIGFDIHRFVPGRKLFIGGVDIPHKKGLAGHSDADVLLHAIMDALLGAAGLGDIGEWFSDRDPKYKGASSAELLKVVLKEIRQQNFRILNVDTVLLTEEPKLKPYKERVRKSCAALLGLSLEKVNIKAKTFEGLGPIGRAQGMGAYCVLTLEAKT